MVNSEVSGVAFSRHPLRPLTSNSVYIESVYGLGEGLVSGEFDADQYEVREREREGEEGGGRETVLLAYIPPHSLLGESC